MRFVILILVLLMFGGGGEALAQASPFGVAPPSSGGVAKEGLLGWVYNQQNTFYRQLTGAVKAIKDDGSALWFLMALSFGYGVFHAAGPGHGKLVISSYMLANEQSAKRGIAISFIAALVQGLVAIMIIAVLAVILQQTSAQVTAAAIRIEQIAYLAIIALGLMLLWRKGRAFFAAMRPLPHIHQHDHHHDHHHHHAGCGCSHSVPPSNDGVITAIMSVGLRPCSGALIVLVFALSQGLFVSGVWAVLAMSFGTAITVSALALMAVGAKGLAQKYLEGSGAGRFIGPVMELVGAVLILLLGLVLFAGSFGG